ncbi:hypothetical protein GCM10012275_52700 [Longimycelium tulufanense]|uniref:Uncharacterized protein n=1 Tax=Longimycelium tulufanense TaxID=907463 RepID=A0A8J3CCV7_9PSEU|nr:hypothetical protein [Longimycelium tulufanense]GGM75480.1 hypothetical protein GCM10012275_52700 [Longimycelium tulufanense]
MVYEYRQPRDYTYGTLSTAAAVSDTSLSANMFAGLGTGYSSALYLPLVLHDPSLEQYEIVWVTAHSSGSQTVTVVRGREGTTARSWPAGTQILSAPTVRDTLLATTRTALPSDGAVGTRAALSDEGVTVERLVSGAWGPSVGVAMPSEVGPNMFGTNPGANRTIVMRAGQFSGTTDADGNVLVVYRQPFPTATLAIVCTSTAYAGIGPYVCWGTTATDAGITVYNGSTTRLANTAVTFLYLALGW